MKRTLKFPSHSLGCLVWLAIIVLNSSVWCNAQSGLSLQQAVNKALQSRASLRAEEERVATTEGLKRQAGQIPNPELQFQNENLRPGQTYTRDVDTVIYLTQPLDVLGKRKQRIAVAEQGVNRAHAEYELARREIVQGVKMAYWAARGAQETSDLLKAAVRNFQKIIDYHSAQLSVGAISEQDFLRVRLEGERMKIAANLALIEATRTRVELLKEMGQTDFAEVVLIEALDGNTVPLNPIAFKQVLEQRVEMKVARVALDEAQAKLRFQDISARPDLSIIAGYKRTQLVDATSGANTAIAGFQLSIPIANKNQGNRAAAEAEIRRQRQLLAATEAGIRADYYAALREFEMRSNEVVAMLQPLREHAATISEIAQGAYAHGGTDLLRLLDAERSRIDAEQAWVQGMVDYQKSLVKLQAAEGASQ